jgi:hypothetical protein
LPGVCEIDCRLNPENWCQRNHSDTLARLIRRHDASETVLREPFGGRREVSDQGFRENVGVGGGTLTPVFRVPTRSNPEFPTLCGFQEATGRRQTVMSNSSRHRRQYRVAPMTIRGDSRSDHRHDAQLAGVHGWP